MGRTQKGRRCRDTQDLSAPRADATSFCGELIPNATSLLAALGIFSIDEHSRHRQFVRSTWLRGAGAAGIAARFVLHGLGARTEVLAEAAASGDVVFVRAPAIMSCKSGPLRKLWLWLECALTAWPLAAMIGKADDDAWLRLPGVALHVSRAHAAAAAAAGGSESPLLMWASIASFHWHEGLHRPVGYTGQRWAYRLLSGGDGLFERCRSRRAPAELLRQRNVPKAWLRGEAAADAAADGGGAGPNVTGPYFFPKGPLYLLSRQLVAETLAGAWARAERERAIASGLADPHSDEATWPWEDVFLGAAIARSVPGGARRQNLFAVHVGGSGYPGVFSEEYGLKMAPATLIWHAVTKGREERFHKLEEWAAARGCDLAFSRLACRAKYVACTGAQWHACEPLLGRARRAGRGQRAQNGSCSMRLENLLTGGS